MHFTLLRTSVYRSIWKDDGGQPTVGRSIANDTQLETVERLEATSELRTNQRKNSRKIYIMIQTYIFFYFQLDDFYLTLTLFDTRTRNIQNTVPDFMAKKNSVRQSMDWNIDIDLLTKLRQITVDFREETKHLNNRYAIK